MMGRSRQAQSTLYSRYAVCPTAWCCHADASSLSELCPQGRWPGNCDFIAYNSDKTCCPESSAIDVQLKKNTLPNTGPEDLCCIDDPASAPYDLKFVGKEKRGVDTAFHFQLQRVDVSYDPATDFDGANGNRTCDAMSLEDITVNIFGNLTVKYVAFNNTQINWRLGKEGAWCENAGDPPESKAITMRVYLGADQIVKSFPYDVHIVVEGETEELCPAAGYMYSRNTCEYSMTGVDPSPTGGDCCPHGLTTPQVEPPPCCIDNPNKSPYKMHYVDYNISASSTHTTYDFSVVASPVTDNCDCDGSEPGICDRHSINSITMAIYDHVSVTEVLVDGVPATFNITDNTQYSKWLQIDNLNAYYPDFEDGMPLSITIKVMDVVRELCPAQAAFGTQLPTCEYAIHGFQAAQECCPHAVTQPKTTA